MFDFRRFSLQEKPRNLFLRLNAAAAAAEVEVLKISSH
jgi:hypothetical protein